MLPVNGLAARLESLETAASHQQESQFSARLISMISELSLVTSSKELYQQILEMAAELLSASSGSLMLLNESDGTLKIETAKGMYPALAKAMSVTFGEELLDTSPKVAFRCWSTTSNGTSVSPTGIGHASKPNCSSACRSNQKVETDRSSDL